MTSALRHIFRIMLLISAWILPCGCGDAMPEAEVDNLAAGESYLHLSLSVANERGATRSNPTGGEIGDIEGGEAGIWHENDIDNIMVWIYDDSAGKGLDDPSYTPVIISAYADGEDIVPTSTGVGFACKVESYRYSPTHKVIVAANVGNLTRRFSTIGDVRRHIVQASRIDGDADITTSRHFVMASALNTPEQGMVTLIHTGEGSAKNPNYKAECSVERLSARIDIATADASYFDTSDCKIKYQVKGGKSEHPASRVNITEVYPLNVMQHPSTLLKHLTESVEGPWLTDKFLICADETMSGVIPSRYVVEPRTMLKKADTGVATLIDWYGTTAVSLREKQVSASGHSYLQRSMPSLHSIDAALNAGNSAAITIAYADENTQPADMHLRQFTTGLLLRAEYLPGCIYLNAEKSDSITGITEARTFFRYRPTSRAFSDAICLYFDSKADAEEYSKAHPEDIAEIEDFIDGVCWYTVWIRHANDYPADPHADPMPMEYAIVRNNIYSLSFEFRGPGTPAPLLRDPETIDLRIFVRKWNFRQQSQIVI